MSILRRQCPGSPAAAAPLEVDDLLAEILLRLPPLPSSLPRVSLVCKRWRGLVSDPGFSRRFRRHHHRRRNPPPLLGFFSPAYGGISFHPTMDPPNRVPAGRLSMPPSSDARFPLMLLGCRHGLLLMLDQKRKRVLVWDPVTGDQHGLAVPPALDTDGTRMVGAVLRRDDVGGDDAHHRFQFQVVLAHCYKQQLLACVYSSETGVWTHLIPTHPPYVYPNSIMFFTDTPAVLAGDSLYWKVIGIPRAILQLDLDRQSLAVIHLPGYMRRHGMYCDHRVMRAEGGGVGLFFMSGRTIELWKRNTDCDGADSWVRKRTIELEKLLSLNSWVKGRTIDLEKLHSLNSEERTSLRIVGFAEYNNVVFLHTDTELFIVHLESLQFEKFSKRGKVSCYPFESVYASCR